MSGPRQSEQFMTEKGSYGPGKLPRFVKTTQRSTIGKENVTDL